MKTLRLKTWRDLWLFKARTTLVVLAIAVGASAPSAWHWPVVHVDWSAFWIASSVAGPHLPSASTPRAAWAFWSAAMAASFHAAPTSPV